MTATYRQQPVTVLRAAKEGDPDWDVACEDGQVLIKNGDGTETVAPKDQVIGADDPKDEVTKTPPNFSSNQNPNKSKF